MKLLLILVVLLIVILHHKGTYCSPTGNYIHLYRSIHVSLLLLAADYEKLKNKFFTTKLAIKKFNNQSSGKELEIDVVDKGAFNL